MSSERMTVESDSSGLAGGGPRLAGRRALVTGAASGIGRATAIRLAADGADVIVNYSRSSGPARELVEQLQQDGVRALAVKADVSAEGEVIGMLERARSELGGILTSINTDLIENPEKRKQVEEEIPWGRMGRPEEIAAAIAWLAGPEAEYVTGTTVFVDGGMTLYPGFV